MVWISCRDRVHHIENLAAFEPCLHPKIIWIYILDVLLKVYSLKPLDSLSQILLLKCPHLHCCQDVQTQSQLCPQRPCCLYPLSGRCQQTRQPSQTSRLSRSCQHRTDETPSAACPGLQEVKFESKIQGTIKLGKPCSVFALLLKYFLLGYPLVLIGPDTWYCQFFILFTLTSGELVDMQCILLTNSTKVKLPLLSLSNVENIKFETVSTVSTGRRSSNIAFTLLFSNLACNAMCRSLRGLPEPAYLGALEYELPVPLSDVLHQETSVGHQELLILLCEKSRLPLSLL